MSADAPYRPMPEATKHREELNRRSPDRVRGSTFSRTRAWRKLGGSMMHDVMSSIAVSALLFTYLIYMSDLQSHVAMIASPLFRAAELCRLAELRCYLGPDRSISVGQRNAAVL